MKGRVKARDAEYEGAEHSAWLTSSPVLAMRAGWVAGAEGAVAVAGKHMRQVLGDDMTHHHLILKSHPIISGIVRINIRDMVSQCIRNVASLSSV